MTKPYEDAVSRTLELYGTQIGEALTQLRDDNPEFGRYETPAGQHVEAKYDGKSLTGLSFADTKILEAKVRELTGDENARLVRLIAERFGPNIVGFSATSGEAGLSCDREPQYRIDDSLNRVAPILLDERFMKKE